MSRIALLLALLLAGCHAHTGVSLGPDTSSVAPTGIHVRTGTAARALIVLGAMAAIIGSEDDYARRAPPELDPTRRVREQDCSQPIEDPAANLRCQ